MLNTKLAVCLVFGMCLVLLAGCATSPEVIPTTTASSPPAASSPSSSLLPHSLYYLSDLPGGIFQVWFVEHDGSTVHQLTSEAEDVSEFDVSPVDGRVAFVSGNQLYLVNADGSGRTLLVPGSLPQEDNPAFLYTEKITGLSWSPGGDRLAFGLNGLHVIELSTLMDVTLIENVVSQSETGVLLPELLFKPISWAPDAGYLLLEIDFFEGGTLGTYDLQTGEMVRFGGEGIVCCQPTWSPDSASVVVASPMFGIAPAGLWRYDARTGAAIELIHHTSENGTLNFVDWPVVLPDGRLRYFFNNLAEFPPDQPSLLMVAANRDGVTGRELIRTEYFDNYEVLWAEDGSLAVTIQPATGVQSGWPRTGPVLIIPASGEPPIPLPAYGYSLRWGP